MFSGLKFLTCSVIIISYFEEGSSDVLKENIKNATITCHKSLMNNSKCALTCGDASMCKPMSKYYNCNNSPEITFNGTLNFTSFEDNIFNDLECVSLQHNKISSVENNIFDKMNNLKYMSLNNNTLKQLPRYAFATLANLLHLDLSKNELATLPDEIFMNLTSLEVLKLQENSLDNLGSTSVFSNLHNLKYLSLSFNRIALLPRKQFISLKQLNVLRINNNRLAQIHLEMFEPLASLHFLTINNNPVSCNFEIRRLRSWCESKKLKLDINCNVAKSNENTKLFKFQNIHNCLRLGIDIKKRKDNEPNKQNDENDDKSNRDRVKDNNFRPWKPPDIFNKYGGKENDDFMKKKSGPDDSEKRDNNVPKNDINKYIPYYDTKKNENSEQDINMENEHGVKNSQTFVFVAVGISILLIGILFVYCLWSWKMKSKSNNETQQ